MKQVLMIEDDPAIVGLVKVYLSDLPGTLTATSSGADGLQLFKQQPFDVCILDVMLPGSDGVRLCQEIRSFDTQTPILMLTAKSDEHDIVAGLEAGADDYLIKPFGQHELLARIKALLRRNERSSADNPAAQEPTIYRYKDLFIDLDKRYVTLRGNRIDLTPKEFDLLVLLAQHPGKSYSRKELLSTVWGYTFAGYEHTVTAHVNRLRSKIEPSFAQPIYILTAWGVGYRFADTQSQQQPDES
ncbi:response regulator transcription factor [Spirosoma migulaei]